MKGMETSPLVRYSTIQTWNDFDAWREKWRRRGEANRPHRSSRGCEERRPSENEFRAIEAKLRWLDAVRSAAHNFDLFLAYTVMAESCLQVAAPDLWERFLEAREIDPYLIITEWDRWPELENQIFPWQPGKLVRMLSGDPKFRAAEVLNRSADESYGYHEWQELSPELQSAFSDRIDVLLRQEGASHTRKPLSGRLTKKVYQREENQCWFCGEDLRRTARTVTRLIPESQGGKTDEDNLVAACRSCSASKRNRTLEEFREVRRLQHPAAMAATLIERAMATHPTVFDGELRRMADEYWSQVPPLLFYGERRNDRISS